MEKKLGFALVGCGKIAPRHAQQMMQYGSLLAVCDTVKEKADAFALQYNATAYYNIDELLATENNIDIIAICTPNGMHAEHCIKSAQAGKNVLCEKPLCITGVAAWQMMETAKYCNKKLFVVKSTRYTPALFTLKKLLDENKLGTVYSFQLNCLWNRPDTYYEESWRGTLFPDGGTLYTQFSHYIDALLWLLGDVKDISGYRKNSAHKGSIEFEDNGVVSLLMESGAIGGVNWSVNTFNKNMEVSLTIIAEKGTIQIGGEYMHQVRYQQTPGNVTFEDLPGSNKANDYGEYKGSMSNHDKVYENLAKAMDDEKHPFPNGFDGLKTVELIERIYKKITLQ